MSAHEYGFNAAFESVTGYAPFCWQQRLYARLAAGDIPTRCDLPTGLGKTSVIPIWLVARAHSDEAGGDSPKLPRRLVYIVNRRTVVDQATDDAKRLLGRLHRSGQRDHLPWATDDAMARLGLSDEPPLSGEHAPTVATLRKALSALSGDDHAAPLAVSTLRGELADNGEWKTNPARPAIIIGTIDMIGSKLLFSGYGDGRYNRPHHAGLIGQDALIVHDEAHLSPAFGRLVQSVEEEQTREQARNGSTPLVMRLLRVMELSATTRRDNDGGVSYRTLGIQDEDSRDAVVQQRLTAAKRLSLVEVDDGKRVALAGKIAEEAVRHANKRCRVLIYVQSPETAAQVQDDIRKRLKLSEEAAGKQIGLLTGTIRGHERDLLANSELFQAFRSNPNRSLQLDGPTLYLVSTSAGEVGVDLDADHLVGDLTTLDSMGQRFGRVNRLGGKDKKTGKRRRAEITVVLERESKSDTKKEKQSPFADAVAATREILHKIASDDGDVSPAALRPVLESDEAGAAFSPTPTILSATDILFDNWSLTSIRGDLPGRPEVGPYLHGIAEHEPPETYVAWRAEIADLARAGMREDDLEEIFDVFPLRTVERLRDRTYRVLDHLATIAQRHPDSKAIIIKNNVARWAALSEFALAEKRGKDQARARLAFATVVLPVEVGGLKNGCLDGSAERAVEDVAELPAGGQTVRQRVWVTDESSRPLLGDSLADGLVTRYWLRLSDEEFAGEDAQASRGIEYRVAKAEVGEPKVDVLLREHASAGEAAAKRIAAALVIPDSLREALSIAARYHDDGKDRPVWQRFARNNDASKPLAKAKRYLHGQTLEGYRHEFGSVLEATLGLDGSSPPPEIAEHPERDLILHLIAAHHGWARPHFDSRASDNERFTTTQNEVASAEVMQRFGRLQQRFGRWGLAWLESVLRCADIAASKQSAVSTRAAQPQEVQA